MNALALVIILLAKVFYYSSAFARYANHISENTRLSIENLFQNTLPVSFIFILCLLYARILAGLSKFLEAKNKNCSTAIQKAALASLPKYIIISYLISIFQVYVPLAISENNNVNFLNNYTGFLFPEFGNALGLVLAFIIYSYIKSLNEHEIATKEIDQLKHEADLVI